MGMQGSLCVRECARVCKGLCVCKGASMCMGVPRDCCWVCKGAGRARARVPACAQEAHGVRVRACSAGGSAGCARAPPASARRAGGSPFRPPAPRPLAPLLYEAICFSRSQILGEKPRLPGEHRGAAAPVRPA